MIVCACVATSAERMAPTHPERFTRDRLGEKITHDAK
jgi:hypothetical protein